MMEVMTQPLLGLDVPARCNMSHVTRHTLSQCTLPQVGGHDLSRDRGHSETGHSDNLAVDDVGRLVLAVEHTGSLGRDPHDVVRGVASVERQPDPGRQVEVEH